MDKVTIVKSIVYESEAVAEAMDIGSLDAKVQVVTENGVLKSVMLIKDLKGIYKSNNAFKREIDLKLTNG